MGDNELKVNEPRIGWYFDDLPEEVTPSTATMLVDDGSSIRLTIPWSSEHGHGQVAHWFLGKHLRSVDAQERDLIEELPEELGFWDPRGPVVLVGCSSAGATGLFGLGGGEGYVNVDAAVLGGVRLTYSDIEAMQTEIPGSVHWFGLGSVKHEVKTEEGRTTAVVLQTESQEEVALTRDGTLRLRPHWNAIHSQSGRHTLEERVFLESRSDRGIPWRDHLRRHLAVRDIVDLATWKPTGYSLINVRSEADDRPGYLREGEPWWREMRTYVVRRQSEPMDTPLPLFVFDDVGVEGYRRWAEVRKHFNRGTVPLLSLLDLTDAHLEARLVVASIGLESIGIQMCVEQGMTPKQVKDEWLSKKLRRIYDEIPNCPLSENWPDRAARIYNDVKHASRGQLPELLDMHTVLMENILAFRLWAAHRIGIDEAIIHQNQQRTTHYQTLAQRGVLAAHVGDGQP